MKGIEEVRQAVAGYLREQGLDAVTAWSGEGRKPPGKAVSVVSLRGLESMGSGLQNYLGEWYDSTVGRWEERYGKQVKLTLGLDVYAGTAEEVQAGVDLLRDILDGGGPGGMTAMEFSAGEPGYDPEARRYQCPAQAKFEVWAVAVTREDGTFLDFEVKGERGT